ncbi:MAG: hypothetical protein HQK53_13065 [Oligoflexia bacterium]|nr:hypothetical protein [Oligoflexia bacterium]
MKKIIYYITSHGFGHAVRSCDIINALFSVMGAENLDLTVVSTISTSLLQNRLVGNFYRNNFHLRQASFDVGMYQLDSLRFDVGKTIIELENIYRAREQLLQQEISFLKASSPAVIVTDIPSLPIVAAKKCDIPAIAVGNFSWDWIYQHQDLKQHNWKKYIDFFQDGYCKTNLLLRLPFAEEMAIFPNKIDLPLLSTPGVNKREQIAALLKLDQSICKNKWVLISFTDLQLIPKELSAFAQNMSRLLDLGYTFFTTAPFELHMPNVYKIAAPDNTTMGTEIIFKNILASMDVVISKPGYGILSEAISNKKPFIYTDRMSFPEYPILVSAIQKYLPQVYLESTEIRCGDFEDALKRINSINKDFIFTEDVTTKGNGDLIAAKIINEFVL